MTIWFTSDTHYGHVNIIKYSNRPFKSIDEMDSELIRRWNEVVKAGDQVFHLGDVMMGPNVATRLQVLRPALNGYIILVQGNHDRGPGIYRKAGFDHVCSRWDGALPDDNGVRILMRHHPPERPEPRHAEYDLILCGHVHEKWLNRGKVVNVGVDQWNYTPVSLETLVQRFASRRR